MQAVQNPTGQPSRHLLKIEDLNSSTIEHFLKRGEYFAQRFRRGDKKEPNLHGRTVINFFQEPSTRTSTSFDIAAKRLGADVINVDTANSSLTKGESLADTAITLNAMHPDAIVVRHSDAEALQAFATHIQGSVINGGDGSGEHPTQALLDALTIRQAKGRIEGLTVAICGDILHSRVANSNAALLTRLGAKVRFVGPTALLPKTDVETFNDMKSGLSGADIVMMLRIQRERLEGMLAISNADYFRKFGLDAEKLKFAKPDAYVMHPGPMNRGIEIEGSLADSPRSLITKQVENGVAIRAAVLETLILRQIDRPSL